MSFSFILMIVFSLFQFDWEFASSQLRHAASTDSSSGIAVANILSLTPSFTSPYPHPARAFSRFTWELMSQVASHWMCGVLYEAGTHVVLFQLLRTWSSDTEVLSWACSAIEKLSACGIPSLQDQMRALHDCEALLRAAATSGLDVKYDSQHSSPASRALRNLGLLRDDDLLVRHAE